MAKTVLIAGDPSAPAGLLEIHAEQWVNEPIVGRMVAQRTIEFRGPPLKPVLELTLTRVRPIAEAEFERALSTPKTGVEDLFRGAVDVRYVADFRGEQAVYTQVGDDGRIQTMTESESPRGRAVTSVRTTGWLVLAAVVSAVAIWSWKGRSLTAQ